MAAQMKQPFQGLYLHIPFCARRCAYCDFATEAVDDTSPQIDEYVSGLVNSVKLAARGGLLDRIRTIYIGGGTPSYLGAARLDRLLGVIGEFVDLVNVVEFTMEANPDSFSEEVARTAASRGVTRFSIGVQSTDDATLARLGRIHDAQTARDALKIAVANVTNVSADIICGVMGATRGSLLHSLLEVTRFGAKHVSVYPLAIEDGTPLARAIDAGECEGVDEDEQAEQMQAVRDALLLMGPLRYERYEVSNYAVPGYHSRHNTSYWEGIPYLGIGRGAASMLCAEDEQQLLDSGALAAWGLSVDADGLLPRTRPVARTRIATGSECYVEHLSAHEAAAEDFMLAMRTVWGIGWERLSELAELNPALLDAAREIVVKGLARWTGEHAWDEGSCGDVRCASEPGRGRLVPTERGWLMGNELYEAVWSRA